MKNRNLRSIFALVLSTVLFTSVLTPAVLAADEPAAAESAKASAADTARPGRKLRTETGEPENAIGKDAAVARALAEAGISAEQAGDIRVHVTENSDGSIVYRVHFTADGRRYSSKVDAVSGEILCEDASGASEDTSGQAQNRRSDGQGRDDKQNLRGGRGQSNGGRSGGDRGKNQNLRGGKRDGSCLEPESNTEA